MARPALEAVYDPPAAEVDIVAVHGLGANADWTWIWKDPKVRSNQVRWLSDPGMLPTVIPKARVILYNYDSRWHADAPRITLKICGDRFIQTLHDFRKNLPKRPIVFLGHSLGSIVIQQGLLAADTRDDLRYLTTVTSGLVTLGSPLRGIKKNVQPSFLVKLLQFRGSWGGIIDELKYENDALLDKLERFIKLAKARQIDIFCFFELYETKFGKKFFLGGKFGVPLRAMIVPETSACLSGFDRCGLQADHFRINKFSGPNDPSFTRVSAQLLQLCTVASQNAQEKASSHLSSCEAHNDGPPLESNHAEIDQCLKNLFLTNPMDDLSTMKRMKGERAQGTCEWIIKTDEMRLWLSQTHSEPGTPASNFLWLQGDPGVGKSTMAVFLVEHLLSTSMSAQGHSTAFFLCSSTFDTRNSVTAILRGLLWQLLSENRAMIPKHVLPAYKTQGNSIFVSFDNLWFIFISIMGDKDSGIKLLVVDGLDECKADGVFALLKMIRGAFGPKGALRDSPCCRLLVLSRPTLDIQRFFRTLRAVNLSTSSEIREDIATFIEEKVSDLEISIPYPPAVAQKVAQTLKHKAGGTFLWAGIACAELDRCDAKDAMQCLDTLPSTLNDLYKDILSSACGQDAKNIEKIRQLLGFAITAMYPLSLLELAAACKLHTDHPAQLKTAFMLEEIESCRRLLVVDNGRVHVLHESVKDFLQSEASGVFIDAQVTHAELTHRCIEVIYWSTIDIEPSSARRLLWSGAIEWSRFDPGFGQVRDIPEDMVPANLILLGYAVFRWPAHARSACQKFSLAGLALLFFDSRSVLWKAWSAVFLAHLMQPSITSGHFDEYAGRSWLSWTPLDVAALTDNSVLASFALQQQRIRVEGRHLMYAAVERHWGMLNILIGHMTSLVALSEDAIVKFVEYRYGWLRAPEVLRILFTHPKITVSLSPTLLLTSAQNSMTLFHLLLEFRPDHMVFDPPSIQRWMENWKDVNNHVKASIVLVNLQVPGFIDSDLLMERLVSMDNERWPAEGILKMMELLCHYRSEDTPITQNTWFKAAGNHDLGPNLVRLLPERDMPILETEQEALIAAAACNLNRGTEVLKTLFQKSPATLPLIVNTSALSASLKKGGEEQVRTLLKHSTLNESQLQGEDILISACSNVNQSMSFLFADIHVPTHKITEKVLLAAAKNEVYGSELFEMFLDTHQSLIPLSEPVVLEAAQSGLGLFDLLLERRAFDKSRFTRALYDRIEMKEPHSRSGNLSKCLLRRRDPELPPPDIKAVSRYLTSHDVEELLLWQGNHIMTKEVVLIAMHDTRALIMRDDLLPIIHGADPGLVMIDTETLDYARDNFPSTGFYMPTLVVNRVREVRGGHLLADEEEALRIWWPRHGTLGVQYIKQELMETRQKYRNLELEEARASALDHYSGSTGGVSSGRDRRASFSFTSFRSMSNVEREFKRRDSSSV